MKAGFRGLTALQQKTIPLLVAGRSLLVEAGPGSGKTVATMTAILLAHRAQRPGVVAILLADGEEPLRNAQRQWKTLAKAAASPLTHAVIGVEDGIRREANLLGQRPNVVIASPQRLIDHIRQGNIDLDDIGLLAADVPPGSPEFLRDVEFILSKCPSDRQTAFFVAGLDEDTRTYLGGGRQQLVLEAAAWQAAEPEPEPEPPADTQAGPRSRPRGREPADHRRNDVSNGVPDGSRGETRGSATQTEADEALTATIKAQLERMTEQGDSAEIGRITRIFRHAVPLRLRAPLAAFLLREIGGKPPSGRSQSGRGASAKAATGRSAAAGKPAAGAKAARLFINAGRTRRIFPDDIYALFTSQLGVERSEILEVRVMDNYSFVEIAARHADRAIAELTGKELRGRKLTVDYARPREDKRRE